MTYKIRCERCIYSETFMDINANSLEEAMEIAELEKDFADYRDYDEKFNCHNVS